MCHKDTPVYMFTAYLCMFCAMTPVIHAMKKCQRRSLQQLNDIPLMQVDMSWKSCMAECSSSLQ